MTNIGQNVREFSLTVSWIAEYHQKSIELETVPLISVRSVAIQLNFIICLVEVSLKVAWRHVCT